jgi:hypothetical protein
LQKTQAFFNLCYSFVLLIARNFSNRLPSAIACDEFYSAGNSITDQNLSLLQRMLLQRQGSEDVLA